MHSRPFLICALPRSRTAWLANLLTYGNVRCGHELTSVFHEPEKLAEHLTSDDCYFSGNADTFQAARLNEIMHFIPSARLVVVRRDPDDVLRSLDAIGVPIQKEQVYGMASAIKHAAKVPGSLTVEYSALDSFAAIKAIFTHVAPLECFDTRRWNMLCGLNVQVTPERIVELQRLAEQNLS